MENVDRFIVWLDKEGGWHSCIANSDADEQELRKELKEPILECEKIWTVFIPQQRRGYYEGYRHEAIVLAKTKYRKEIE